MKIPRRPKSKNRRLTTTQVRQVNEYALRLIEEIGCEVQSQEALDILAQAGCDISNPKRVKIARKLVLEAIEAAPGTIEIYNSEGELAMVLAEGSCYYGTGSDCPTTIDLWTGERRQSTKEDVGGLARFCDALPNIDFVMSFGIANDAPPGHSFVHQYDAMLSNTSKPIIVTGHGRNDMMTMIEMAAAMAGGMDSLRARPPLILYSEPLSPLVHTEMGLSKALLCCEYGIPFIYIASPMMGASSPATLEGTLVQAVAESLAGLVIFQRKQPGAKFIFGGDASVLDMRTSIFSYGSPELNAINAALADMAHFYGLPFFCIAGSTDSKVLDAQAGLEYALSIYDATLNGCNIIHDCGYLEFGSTSSFESVLFADEAIALVKSMLRPLRFTNATVPLGLVDQIGPGGHFLLEEHTLANFKRVFWFPRFLDRRRFEEWRRAGSQDLRTALNEKARQIIAEHQPRALSAQVRGQIDTLITKHRPDV